MTYKEAEDIVKEVHGSGLRITQYFKKCDKYSRSNYYRARNMLIDDGIDVDLMYPKAPRIPEDLKKIKNVVDGKKDIFICRKKNGSTTLRIPSDIDTDVLITILDALGITSGEVGIELV